MRKLTPAAQAAKMIKSELKKAFPSVVFRVVSDNYSMGDAVRISWVDGVTTEQVNDIARKYQYGSFDGMTDSYEYTNNRDDIPQTKYVQLARNYSDHAIGTLFEEIKYAYVGFDTVTDIDESNRELFEQYGTWTIRNFIYRILVKRDLTK